MRFTANYDNEGMTMDILGNDLDDAAKYEALKREDAEYHDDGPGGDLGGSEPAGRSQRESEAPTEDEADAIERAALEADELETQYARQPRERQANPYDDPIAYLERTNKRIDSIHSAIEHKRFLDHVGQAEDEFKATTPDYHDAAEFLEKSRRNELAALYPDRSPQAHLMARQNGFKTPAQMREAIFRRDAQTVAVQAMQAGVNPAEAYYNLAKGRGFQSRGGGRAAPSGGQASRGSKAAAVNLDKLSDLYVDDPEAFDREWEKAARSGAFG